MISTADRARSMIQQLETDLVFQTERGKKLSDRLAERTPSESMTRELDKYREAYRQTAITVKKLRALLDAPKITVAALKAIAQVGLTQPNKQTSWIQPRNRKLTVPEESLK